MVYQNTLDFLKYKVTNYLLIITYLICSSFGKDGCGSKLRRLKLSGCATVTDFTLTRVAEAINNDKLKLDYDTCYCMNAINNRMRKWNECMKNMQSITGDIEEDKDLNSEKSMKKASICDECEERTSNCETKNKSVTYVETNISCETLETTYGTKSASKTGETDETNIEDVPGVACCRDKDTVMSAPNTNETVNTMEYLDLSGCYMITNNGLRFVMSLKFQMIKMYITDNMKKAEQFRICIHIRILSMNSQ